MSGPDVLCQICGQQKAIYTCPRCAKRSCSLTCSKSHKALQSCSGERDKATFVPMNRYNWGTMADDYAYLEQVGRKTTEWGRDIVKNKYLSNIAKRGRGKREFLKTQLAARSMDMELMPPGMERRILNQSTWDSKTKLPVMTIEFLFHPSSLASPLSILTHRNKLTCNISEVLRRHWQARHQKDSGLEWIETHMKDEKREQYSFLIAQPSDLPQYSSSVYHTLDPTQPLLGNLRHKTFVEYPTIEVWEKGDFTGLVVDIDGRVTETLSERPPKRQRLSVAEDNAPMKELAGAYGGAKGGEGTILTILGTYRSDDDTSTDNGDITFINASEGSESESAAEPTLEKIHELLGAADGSLPTENNLNWLVEDEEDHGSDWESN